MGRCGEQESAAALVQIHAGFVDLAAQVAPLVRGQAAAGAARIFALGLRVLWRLLRLLLLGAALVVVGAQFGLALAAVLLRQRKPLASTLVLVVTAIAAVLLCGSRADAKNQGARQRTAKDDARNAHCLRCCLVDVVRAIHWCSSSAMPF
jgi:hypothetical protein